MKPKAFRLSRLEYQKFSIDVFRKHIYQETRNHIETPYWIYKKKKKEEKKKKKEKKGTRDEEEQNFFYDPVLEL